MQNSENERQYIENVLSLVKWKEAHATIGQELLSHITDQKEAFVASGYCEEEARKMAVCEMGNAQEVGEAFNKVYHPKTDWILLTAVVLLLGFGIFAWLYSHLEFTVMDGIAVFIGGVILLIGCRIDYRKLFCHVGILYSIYLVMLIFICLFGRKVNGASVFIWGIRIQEYLLFFPFLYGLVLYRMRGDSILGLGISVILGLIPLFFGMTDHFGAVVVPGMVCFIMTIASVGKGWFGKNKYSLFCIISVPVATLIILCSNARFRYVFQRFRYIFYPELDAEGQGYTGSCIRKALEGAKWFGSADNIEQYVISQLLPETEKYNILTVLTQRFGWIVFFLVVCAALLLLYRGIRICIKQQNAEGQILAIAAVSVLGISFLMGFLNNIGILLVRSVVLPILSHSNAEMILYLFYIGLLLSIFRYFPLARSDSWERTMKFLEKKWISYDDGVLSIRFRN